MQRGEIAHVHQSDGSAHVVLSFADAKEVIAKGWGERHELVGGMILPWGYVFLYAPRDEGEVEVMKRIFEAGVGFMMSG